jgi:two-component system response regulator NreC
MNDIRVLIVDDHAMVRAGLRALLETQAGITVVGEAEDGVSAVERCRQLQPNVVLMDLTMPGRGGIRATEDIQREFPGVRVLVLTMHDDAAYVRQALVAGAAGYVLKKSLSSDLIRAIHAVHAGARYLPAQIHLSPPAAPAQPLTEREREVVRLIALGHTNSEIGRMLHISEKTVETHRAHIFEKLHLETRADLVRYALEHGLLGES